MILPVFFPLFSNDQIDGGARNSVKVAAFKTGGGKGESARRERRTGDGRRDGLAFVAVNAFMGVSVGRRGGKAAWHPRERTA